MSRDVVRVVRKVDASPEAVFAYLTSSEKWSLWQGVTATIEPTPGGTYTMQAPNGGTARGEVVEVIPNKRISFTWGWEAHPVVPPGSTTVTIELTVEGEKTIITLTHSGLPDAEVGLHRRGWDHYATRLARVSAGIDVGPDEGLSA